MTNIPLIWGHAIRTYRITGEIIKILARDTRSAATVSITETITTRTGTGLTGETSCVGICPRWTNIPAESAVKIIATHTGSAIR